MIPQTDYQMLLLTRLAEQSLKAVGPAGGLELELAPVEINELAVSFAVKSYYFHIALNSFLVLIPGVLLYQVIHLHVADIAAVLGVQVVVA